MGLGDDLGNQIVHSFWEFLKLMAGSFYESAKFMFGQITMLFTKRGKF